MLCNMFLNIFKQRFVNIIVCLYLCIAKQKDSYLTLCFAQVRETIFIILNFPYKNNTK